MRPAKVTLTQVSERLCWPLRIGKSIRVSGAIDLVGLDAFFLTCVRTFQASRARLGLLMKTWMVVFNTKEGANAFGQPRVRLAYLFRMIPIRDLRPFAVTTLVATAAPSRPLGEYRHNQPNISSSHGAR